jgi:hypothetical protein
MIEFELFRIKVFALEQAGIFAAEVFNPSLALVAAIRKTPSLEIRRGHTWHIGNVEVVDDFGMYFALGRTTKTTKPLYDEGERKFVEVSEEAAPYTHVLCDTSREVCGIAKQHDLAPTTAGIARQLETLLTSTSDRSESTSYRFEISAIRDPTDFLQQIRDAYAVTRFAVGFSLPNAWDVDEHIQRPVEEYAKAAHAKKGLLQVTGPDLDRDVVERVARSSAASGNEVTASIRTSKKATPVKRNLKGNPASVKESTDVTTQQHKSSILGSIRELYGRIRRGNGDS